MPPFHKKVGAWLKSLKHDFSGRARAYRRAQRVHRLGRDALSSKWAARRIRRVIDSLEAVSVNLKHQASTPSAGVKWEFDTPASIKLEVVDALKRDLEAMAQQAESYAQSAMPQSVKDTALSRRRLKNFERKAPREYYELFGEEKLKQIEWLVQTIPQTLYGHRDVDRVLLGAMANFIRSGGKGNLKQILEEAIARGKKHALEKIDRDAMPWHGEWGFPDQLKSHVFSPGWARRARERHARGEGVGSFDAYLLFMDMIERGDFTPPQRSLGGSGNKDQKNLGD